LGAPNNVVPVPVVPPPNSEGAVVVPPVEGAGFGLFPKILPPLPNGVGLGAGEDGFAPNKPPGVVPGAGIVEVVPPPNRPPPVAGVVVVVPGVGVVEVAPKSEPAGLAPKMFPGAVVVVVSVPVVPVPVAGVVLV
jgi:hypothetical protein